MRQGMFEVLVRPKGRSAADEYPFRGQTWIEGRHNSSYVIELVNHSSNRVEAVVSVDGLCVRNGNPASFASRGFVLEPNNRQAVEGWLINPQEAASFVFSTRSQSYSEQRGEGGNQGVVGVAWFEEKPPAIPLAHTWHSPINTQPWVFSGNAASTLLSKSGISANSVGASDMGTGFGDSVSFPTTPIQFSRKSNTPAAVCVLHYDSAANLQRMGIVLKTRANNSVRQAFPGETTDYCRPPPSWIGRKWST